MGECNYYLKARFSTPERATSAIPRLSELLRQGEAAYDYWQHSRLCSHLGEKNWQPPTVDVFWAKFDERFPLVHKYLRKFADIADWNNGLAGLLGCLVDPRIPREDDSGASLIQKDNMLLLKLSNIWHFTEMDLLERFCVDDLGAVAVGSVSEEDFDFDDDEDEVMEDWEFFEAIEV